MHAHDVDETNDKIKPLHNSPQSWMAISRSIFDHPVVGPLPDVPWQPFMLWQWMVAFAAYKDQTVNCEGQAVFVRRGQLAFSLRFLAHKANWGVKAVRVFLGRLERFEMITTSTAAAGPTKQLRLALDNLNVVKRGTERGTGKGTGRTVITICNYDKYQVNSIQRGTGRGTGRGTAGAQRSTIIQDLQEDPPLPPKGNDKPSYWQQALNPNSLGDIQFVDGKLTLLNGSYQRWLDEFGGNERKLRLALNEIRVQPNGSESINAQVERKLSRICREALDRDERYAAAVRSNAKEDKPKKLSRW